MHATAGNISARVAGGFLITPTAACLGKLLAQRLAHVGEDGVQTAGDRASKTLAGVWSEHDINRPITPYFVTKVGHVPLIPDHRPGDPQVVELVSNRITAMAARGTPIRAVMLGRLGPNVWQRSPSEASAVLEELEETAKLWLLCRPRPAPLDEAQTEQLLCGQRPAADTDAVGHDPGERLVRTAVGLWQLHSQTGRS